MLYYEFSYLFKKRNPSTAYRLYLLHPFCRAYVQVLLFTMAVVFRNLLSAPPVHISLHGLVPTGQKKLLLSFAVACP